ncbi:MAG: class I SAM-dependent methyltransferase [Candidatus Beckwithbacteria bacterium]|nr:class I SAM-dependent methyltransferase [Patescibacteria group bacterium]
MKFVIKSFLSKINDLEKAYEQKQRLRELRRVIGKKGFSLLDLGCGDGKLVKMACGQGIKAVGVDKKQGQNIENYKPACAGKVPYLVNVVSMYHVLEHLDKPVEVLKKVKGWLKPGGMVAIEVPLVGNFSEKWLGKDYLAYWDKTHVNFWTKREFLEVVERAGYKVIKKGMVWHQVFFHVITAKFKSGIGPSLVGVMLWPWLKLLSIMGFNDEMMRVYLKITYIKSR